MRRQRVSRDRMFCSFCVDDMTDWVNCLRGYAGRFQTPNIDRLAARGVLFTNAQCAPSRASLLTGMRRDTLQVWDPPARFRVHRSDSVTLSDGRQMLVYNHTVKGGEFPASRNMLNFALSDDGRSWHPVATLERAAGEYSYPAVIQSRDGLVHIAYTWKRQTIRHVTLDPKRLQINP